MWDAFVELIRMLIFAVAHACGGNIGGSIAIVSFTVRIALIPLTLRVQKRAREKQRVLEGLKPLIERLQKRYAKDPRRVAQETFLLYKKHGIQFFDRLTVVSFAIQAPPLSGLFSAVRSGLGAGKRFLWVADLSRPDALFAFVASGLVGLSMWIGASGTMSDAAAQTALRVSLVISVGMTLMFLLSASSGVAVSVAAGALGAGVQGWVGRGKSAK